MGKINNLSMDEKLELIDELWESVISDQENLKLTEAQKQELDRRLAKYEIDKDEGDDWEVVKKRILSKK